ncbi:tRNA (adenosine(37)-N6)-threonylcarbamoyltransferase complex dimerization subunit type 1 TsaB [Sphingobacterium sp. UT-1RO-CII-1]|uniref:tRNA (adenosine(37)-N6)-threonylcarbamoyltransferase complex dimerization subunit type 1 TsaB n=1 Tax=Sphingobacterium sp. UT-1RO-CII-1 TaxID=2995225 RepID=UPI00227BDD03|nr:tRNA (adenosine(37)-N6)-threonylcarbamoyltransferase complex dimerization subunit type 1 TsaB [Sphingobacterium sp. UT-1RO-CII-1]MCY4780075.1 tRNA (adenosine(37)-N6)-threonylcarbamoyltransferase complex dimerization subunit type 1 TsaB [Sphingobacterium sp. UT-1RO-CII-1]
MKNIYILQIETATPVCSVAISLNGETLVSIEAEEQNIHASHLTLFIEKAIMDANLNYSDLSAIAVSEGPGSYTGLRIGVSTAKGLCYGLNIPFIAINTLDAMCSGFLKERKEEYIANSLFIPMLDARRMEVYMATYTADAKLLIKTKAEIIDEDSFSNTEAATVTLFGSGADKFTDLFADNRKVQISPGFKNSAAFMSFLAFVAFESQDFEDLVYFEPYYLKDFIATTPKKR